LRNETYLMQETASAYGTALANSDSSQDGHIAADPAVLLNDNVPAKCRPIAPHSSPWVDRVCRAYELHTRTEDAPSSDSHSASIRDAAISADKHVVTNCYVVSVVTMKRRLYDYTLAAAAEWHFHLWTRDLTAREWRFGIGS